MTSSNMAAERSLADEAVACRRRYYRHPGPFDVSRDTAPARQPLAVSWQRAVEPWLDRRRA